MIPMSSQDCRLPPGHGICVGMPSFIENTPTGQQSMTQQQAEHDRRLPPGAEVDDDGRPMTLPKAAPRPGSRSCAVRRRSPASGAGSPRSTTRRSASSTAAPRWSSSSSAASRRCSSGCSSRARTARCSPRRSTTRCSRCTAPRWCSSSACRSRSRSATTSSRSRSARATSRSRGSTCSGTGSFALRRPVHLLELLPRRRAERRLVRLHAAHQHADHRWRPARPRARLLVRRPGAARHRVHHVRRSTSSSPSSTCARRA